MVNDHCVWELFTRMSHYCTQCISFTTTIAYNAEKDNGSNAATGSSTNNYSNWNSAATTVRFHFTALSRIAVGTGACSIVIQTPSVEAACEFTATRPCFLQSRTFWSSTAWDGVLPSCSSLASSSTASLTMARAPIGPRTHLTILWKTSAVGIT